MENLHRYISFNGTVVVSILESTQMVRDMQKYHGTSATMTATLGQALTAASLMGYGLKTEDEKLTLSIRGNGPAGNITAVSDWIGNVKCCCDDPYVELPVLEKGNFDIARAVGNEGVLYVVSDIGMEVPYVGQIELTDGDIANEVTRYYAGSEQIPTVCALGVVVDRDLSVARAGGYLLQLLPGHTEDEIDTIERNLEGMKGMTQLLAEGKDFDAIANMLLYGLEPNELDCRENAYKCDCSRERMERVLISLGREELTKLAKEQEITEIVCHFCNSKYQFTSEEMLKLAEES